MTLPAVKKSRIVELILRVAIALRTRERTVVLDIREPSAGFSGSFWGKRIAEGTFQERVDSIHFRAFPEGAQKVSRKARVA